MGSGNGIAQTQPKFNASGISNESGTKAESIFGILPESAIWGAESVKAQLSVLGLEVLQLSVLQFRVLLRLYNLLQRLQLSVIIVVYCLN
jgi:hypothetical protein